MLGDHPGPALQFWELSVTSEVRRSFDAAEINPILNDPSVLPSVTVPGIDVIDAGPIVADHRNVALMAEGGCILFIADEPAIYEVHTNFLPAFRGRHAIRASLEAYRWMFANTDCMILQTRVPAFNKAAERFCQIVGATRDFERKAIWPTADGPVDLSFWSMHFHDWLRRAHAVVESGKAFHARLDAEYERHGKPAHSHAEEDCHDRNVGACAEMLYGGQPEKAVILYNRWARFAGYGQIALISRSPIVVDIGEAVLLIEQQTFKVIQCRSAQS